MPTSRRIGPFSLPVLLAAFGAVAALTIGLAAGNPTAATLSPAVLMTCGIAIAAAAMRPFAAFLVLATSTVFLIVILLPGNRGLNLFDLLLPPLIVAGLFGTTREDARRMDLRATREGHEALRAASRRLSRAVIAFYAIAALSVVFMAIAGRTDTAVNSTFSLMRAIQGLLLYPLGLWWLVSERRIHMTMRAMLVGGALVAIASIVALQAEAVVRAGQTWVVNQPDKPIEDPNAAGTAMVFLIGLLIVRQSRIHQFRNVALIGLALGVLVMTQSRSALLACLVFMAVMIPRARRRWIVVGVLTMIAAIPFVPQEYWTRITKTVVLERGSFEAYTSLIRFHAWESAIAVFLDHPWFGVGYLGFRDFSGRYGDLRLVLGTAESYYLSTAAGMGIPGLIALGVVIVRLFQIGSTVRRVVPEGSLAHAMSRIHAPLLLALLVSAITQDIFVGMITLAQFAIWLAMMVRAGHLAIEAAPGEPGPDRR